MLSDQFNEVQRFAITDAISLRALFSVTMNFPLDETKQQTKGGQLACAGGGDAQSETCLESRRDRHANSGSDAENAEAMRPRKSAHRIAGSPGRSPGNLCGNDDGEASAVPGREPPASDFYTHIDCQGSRRAPTRAPGDPQAGWAKQLTEQHTKTTGCPRPDTRWYTPPVHPPGRF